MSESNKEYWLNKWNENRKKKEENETLLFGCSLTLVSIFFYFLFKYGPLFT